MIVLSIDCIEQLGTAPAGRGQPGAVAESRWIKVPE